MLEKRVLLCCISATLVRAFRLVWVVRSVRSNRIFPGPSSQTVLSQLVFLIKFPARSRGPRRPTRRGQTLRDPPPPLLFQRPSRSRVVRQGSRHGTVHRHPMGIRGRRILLLRLFGAE